MKNLFRFLLLAICSATLIFSSCKDDKDDENDTASARDGVIEKLTGGSSRSWKPGVMLINGEAQEKDTCESDDYITIKKSPMTVTTTLGVLKCDSDEVSTTSPWSLSDDGTILTSNDGGSSSKSKLSAVTDASFTLSQTENENTVAITFVRK